MEIENMLMFLNAIDAGYRTSYYLMKYLSYEEIFEIIHTAESDGLIINIHNQYELTEKGKTYRDQMTRRLGDKGIDKKIMKPVKYRVDRISCTDVYLPDKF